MDSVPGTWLRLESTIRMRKAVQKGLSKVLKVHVCVVRSTATQACRKGREGRAGGLRSL